MSQYSSPKETSYEYGKQYQEAMLQFYYQSKVASDSNTEYFRVALAHDLVNNYALPRLNRPSPQEITVVDLGCSVGLFAIDFSKQGYNSIGIDFDPAALEIAAELNRKEGANARFLNSDLADLDLNTPIDIALCFDLFEHLHDDEIGAMLYALKRKLSENGCLVFHTLPMEYDYLFWKQSKGLIEFPVFLRMFKRLRPSRYTRLVQIYALWLDMVNLLQGRSTHKMSIKRSMHCNPLTKERLEDILVRMGYEVIFIETGFLGEVQLDPRDREFFHKQTVTHRSLRGVAILKKQN
jgi:2-polyprenyl-3-methyl-5-hydroxy-6-metoxy-1,4-benzoquinol methylase